MKKVYCISGMGADHRVFSRLHVPGYDFVPLPWVAYDETDNLETYAKKMAVNIKDVDPIILGLSFGGMLATEISKQFPVKQVILVSSAKVNNELPEPGKIARYIVEKKIIPGFVFSIPNRLIMTLRGTVPFGSKIDTGDVKASHGEFMRWSLKVIMAWRNTSYPNTVKHIHGTWDVVIPPHNVRPDHWVKGGGHVMVFTRADDVSKIITGILNNA